MGQAQSGGASVDKGPCSLDGDAAANDQRTFTLVGTLGTVSQRNRMQHMWRKCWDIAFLDAGCLHRWSFPVLKARPGLQDWQLIVNN